MWLCVIICALVQVGWAERKATWSKTGVISLRDAGLSDLPADVFTDLTGALKVADASYNTLSHLPASIAHLTQLQSLKLTSNCLTTEGLAWASLCSLSGLTCLLLDKNRLTRVDPAIGQLTSLR